jgi:hypothetical protein
MARDYPYPVAFSGGVHRFWWDAALAVAASFLIYFCYVWVIAESPTFRYAGAFAVHPSALAPFVGFAFCLLPLAWLRRSVVQASDFIVLYLYFFLFLPTCALMPYVSESDTRSQFVFLAAITLAFGLVELRRVMRPLRWGDFAMPPQTFEWLLIGLAVAALGVLLWTGEVQFSNISFLDVYERRAALLAEGGGTNPIVFYIGNWGSLAISPLLIVYGLDRRKLMMVGLGLLLALVSFLATSFKSSMFIPLFTIGYYFLIRFLGLKRVWEIVALTLIGICVFSIVVDYFVNYAPFVTWSFQFRLVGNNGFLSAKYLDFFTNMPKGLFADTFGRLLYEPVYHRPIAVIVGESFTTVADNHANGNLWADGYGNLGYLGVFFAAFELLIVLWIIDSAGTGKNLLQVVTVTVPAAFSLANTSVHSTLTSNGALLLLVLLVLMPRQTEPASRPAAERGDRPLVPAGDHPK